MAYEIWHGESGNLAGAYPTKTAAIAVLWKALDAHGESYVEGLALLYESGDRTEMIAEGQDLVRIVRATPVGVRRGEASQPTSDPKAPGGGEPVRKVGRTSAVAHRATGKKSATRLRSSR